MSRRRLIALAVVVAAAIAIYASGVLSEIPDPETVIEDIAEALGSWTYLLVAALAFLETGAFVGLIAPGEFTVILGGVIAGQGEINVVLLLALTWLAAFLGDSTSFAIGARLGRGFLERHGPRVKITSERLTQVESYFEKHGGKTILIGRFIGLVRALAPFIAGSSKMPYRRFAPYSVIGTGLWSATFVLLGFFFWRSFERVAGIAGRATIAFGIVVGIGRRGCVRVPQAAPGGGAREARRLVRSAGGGAAARVWLWGVPEARVARSRLRSSGSSGRASRPAGSESS